MVAETAVESPGNRSGADLDPASPGKDTPLGAPSKTQPPQPEKMTLEGTGVEHVERGPASKSPLFWSSVIQGSASASRSNDVAESIPVPPELRNLQKCKACGFPVSQGRTFCVECEEKQWRGQRLPQIGVAGGGTGQGVQRAQISNPTVEPADEAPIAASVAADLPQSVPQNTSGAEILKPIVPSQSWFVANKYILGALVVVGLVIVAMVWLR